MAAKSKQRLSKIENKLLKLDKLELKDVLCSICQSILLEPVTLPCFHDFCLRCFNGSIENNALCCPLCRLRIGSWLRTATKQKNLVNVKLWNFIQTKFPQEIEVKNKGEDIDLPEEIPRLRISEPGEIRSEYEAELTRLRAERIRLEQKHIEQTELLIKQIQQEEEDAHKKYLENLKQDELLAQQMQKNLKESVPQPNTHRRLKPKATVTKAKLKATKIDSYISKLQAAPPLTDSPLITDDNTSTDSTTPRAPVKSINGGSPEMVPSYGKLIKSFIDKKIKNAPSLWNKENGIKEKRDDIPKQSEKEVNEDKVKVKGSVPSLVVSLPLPYTGLLQHKINAIENRSIETGSVDSMSQELCYFKPIEATTPTGFITTKVQPLRVPALRPDKTKSSPVCEPAPTRDQYLKGLCRLRNISLANNLSSAFVIAMDVLKVQKTPLMKSDTSRSKVKKKLSTSPCLAQALPIKRNPNRNKHTIHIDGITKLNTDTNLRRTRSMGSISKDENETTPKKAKVKPRKVSSERKPYLRSDSKKSSTKKESSVPPLMSETLNNNKVNLAVKKLSSPLKNCDVKILLQEQLRIEKIIEQEKKDFELAQQMQAEWNGRRHPRRSSIKRQVTFNYALRPAKKLKV